MGRALHDGDPHGLVTSRPVERLLGNTVWFIVGDGASPKRYSLGSVFVVDAVGDADHQEFRYTASGRGHTFQPPLPLNELPWFSELFRRMAHFSLGVQEVKDPRFVAELIGLAKEAGYQASGGVPMATTLSEYCVYTIVHRDELTKAARRGGPIRFRESKAWATARKLWKQARAGGVGFPVLLGDATDCSRLEYWGLLTDIEVGGKSTQFAVDRLRPLPGKHTPQELVLRDSGEHIAPNYIRPYAICHTPRFLAEQDSADDQENEIVLPEEIDPLLYEGASKQITVNAYERSAEARRRCIEAHGTSCCICGMSFGEVYGPEAVRLYPRPPRSAIVRSRREIPRKSR